MGNIYHEKNKKLVWPCNLQVKCMPVHELVNERKKEEIKNTYLHH